MTDGAIDLRDGAGAAAAAVPGRGVDDPAWLLRAVKERIESLPGVVKVGSGGMGEIATYLPGDRVAGVRVVEGTLQVSLVAAVGIPLVELADDVRRTANWPGRVDVHVADVLVPAPPPAPTTTTLPGSEADAAAVAAHEGPVGAPPVTGAAPITPPVAPGPSTASSTVPMEGTDV